MGATAFWVMLMFGARWDVRLWITVLAILFVPVLLRQLQVIGGVGPTIWATDLLYTAGGKSPLLRTVLPLPSTDEIEAWYRANLIFRGRENSQSVAVAIAELFARRRHLDWLDELGPITWLTACIGLPLAVVLAVRDRVGAPGSPGRRAWTVLSVCLGLGTGFLVFGYHALYYFVVVHQLPMIVMPVCLLVAFVASLLLDAIDRAAPWRAAALAGLVLVLGERLIQQLANLDGLGIRAHPPTSPWGTFNVGPEGGMYGEAGTIVLGVAARGAHRHDLHRDARILADRADAGRVRGPRCEPARVRAPGRPALSTGTAPGAGVRGGLISSSCSCSRSVALPCSA